MSPKVFKLTYHAFSLAQVPDSGPQKNRSMCWVFWPQGADRRVTQLFH